jgi:hypothetical protein
MVGSAGVGLGFFNRCFVGGTDLTGPYALVAHRTVRLAAWFRY